MSARALRLVPVSATINIPPFLVPAGPCGVEVENDRFSQLEASLYIMICMDDVRRMLIVQYPVSVAACEGERREATTAYCNNFHNCLACSAEAHCMWQAATSTFAHFSQYPIITEGKVGGLRGAVFVNWRWGCELCNICKVKSFMTK